MNNGKRKIKARALAGDIANGLGDEELMERYKLTPRQLEDVLSRLVEAGYITEKQLYERTTLSDSIVTKAFVDHHSEEGLD